MILEVAPLVHYSVVNDPLFWTVIGFVFAALGAVFILQYNTNAKLSDVSTGLANLVKVMEEYLGDRKEKDRDYFRWKEKVDAMKTEHGMLTRAGSMLKNHDFGTD